MASYPFDLNKRAYTRLTKLKSIANWKVKKDKSRNNELVIEHWMGRGDIGAGNIGKGYSSGVKITVPQNYEMEKIIAREIYYEPSCDSYIIRDISGNFHRAAFPNAYQNDKYKCQSRGDIDFLLKKCNNLKIW
uniref:Uncharacterized protein n=1 Tax=Marseillevirus LCMAC101 TaxID=2506602 RepID=A0A481YST8_9VIRU|nr:MAG: hypothetical protein LCMAC101_04300 [Marseillevirus LCMAC101]